MKKKEIRRCCTGMTDKDFMKNLKKLDKVENIPKKCYLCKREEGSTSVLVTDSDEKPFIFYKLNLNLLERKMPRDVVFEYYMCLECAALVGIKVKPPFPVRTQKYWLPKSLPAGPTPDYYS